MGSPFLFPFTPSFRMYMNPVKSWYACTQEEKEDRNGDLHYHAAFIYTMRQCVYNVVPGVLYLECTSTHILKSPAPTIVSLATLSKNPCRQDALLGALGHEIGAS